MFYIMLWSFTGVTCFSHDYVATIFWMFTLNHIGKNYEQTIVADCVNFVSTWVCCLDSLISNTHKLIFLL